MATTSDTSIIDRGFIQEFYKRLKGIFASSKDLQANGLSIEIGTATSGTYYHQDKLTTDTVSGVSNQGGYGFFIDPKVTTIYFSKQYTIGYLMPMGSTDFENGHRIVLIGQFAIGEGGENYALDSYAYSRYTIWTDSGINNIGGCPLQAVGPTSSNAPIESHAHLPRQYREEFIYWNKKWYTKGYIPTIVTEYVSSGSTLPVTSAGVYQALGGLDVTDTEVTGKVVTAVSETDGKVSVTRKGYDAFQSATGDVADTTEVIATNKLGGSSTSPLLYRRPLSSIWNYIKGKIEATYSGLDKTGTVTQVKVGTTAYDPSSGVVSLPAYPTVTNNLTSTSTTAALSAAQGKALNDKFGSYLPLSGGTMTGTEPTIIIPGTDSRKTTYSSSDTEHLVATSGWAMGEKWKTADDSTILWRTGARGSDGTSMRYYYQGTDYNAPKIKTLGNGDTGYVGAVTIGMTTNSNNTITGGCKQVYNSTDKCLDFIF